MPIVETMKILKYITPFIFLILLTMVSGAQNSTSSPYSYFGLGDVQNVAYGRNIAIGGTGFGIRESVYLNLKNPASLTAIDSLSVLYETGVFMKFTRNTTLNGDSKYLDGNISSFALGHRYNSRLMAAYGVMPYSQIGYSFLTSKYIEGEVSTVFTQWKGSGGINKVFYSLGLKLNKNFSLGGEAGFYYGPIIKSRTTTIAAEPKSPTTYRVNSQYYGFSLKGAIQFNAKLDDEGSRLVLGGAYSPAYRLSGNADVAIYQEYDATSVLTYTNKERAERIYLPATYGGGASLTLKGKMLLAADYEMASWSINPNNSENKYIDQHIYSFGVERLPRASRNFFEKCSYRAGARFDTGYITYKNVAVNDLRFTLGMGMPLRNSLSTANIAFEIGKRGTLSRGLMEENYSKITVAFSFHDYWFMKRKID